MKDDFKRIERLLRSFEMMKIKYDSLHPRMNYILQQTPNYKNRGQGASSTEQIACEKVSLENNIKLINSLLKIMTPDESKFIKERYFEEKPIEIVADDMNWSRRNIFRLRQSVLSKARCFLDI